MVESNIVVKNDMALSDISREEIKEMVAQFETLTIIPGDKASYENVKSAKNKFVHLRTGIEKQRLKLNKEARATIEDEIKSRDKLAKELTAIFSPAEEHLALELKTEDDRIAKIEQDRIDKIKVKIAAIEVLSELTYDETADQLKTMIETAENIVIDESFEEFQEEARQKQEKVLTFLKSQHDKQANFEIMEAERKVEAERLEKIRLEQEESQKKIDAEKAELERLKKEEEDRKAAEQKKIDDARKAEEEKLKKEREALESEKKRIKQEEDERKRFSRCQQIGLLRQDFPNESIGITEETLMGTSEAEWIEVLNKTREQLELKKKEKEEREAKEREEQAQKEAEEKARQEALRPDKEKLIIFANKIRSFIDDNNVELKDMSSQNIYDSAIHGLIDIADVITEDTEAL